MPPKRTFQDAIGDEEEQARKRGAGRGLSYSQQQVPPGGDFFRPSSSTTGTRNSGTSSSLFPLTSFPRGATRNSDLPAISASETVVPVAPAMYPADHGFLNSGLALSATVAGLPFRVDPRSLNFRRPGTPLSRQALLEHALRYFPGGNPSSFASAYASAAPTPTTTRSMFGLGGALAGAQQALQWNAAAARVHSQGLATSSGLLASLQPPPVIMPRASLPGAGSERVLSSAPAPADNPVLAARPASSAPRNTAASTTSPRCGPTTCRESMPLGIDEDTNWLSEFHCFVRTHLLEVCWASREDVAVRNSSKKVLLDQVGLRCRYCVRLPAGSRAPRSAAFPSSVKQIYQSFTMMLRDHIETCQAIPKPLKEEFLELKNTPCQGATEAKKYWAFAAKKLGMIDTEEGINVNDASRAAPLNMPNFGFLLEEAALINAELADQSTSLSLPEDSQYVSEYYIALLSHFQRIRLLPSERKGNRKTMKAGLPGLGCRYCCEARRFGMSRVFPARRRALPDRVNDLYDHICRCNLCPEESKAQLKQLRSQEEQNPGWQQKTFFDVVWARLGYTSSGTGSRGED